MASNPIDCIKLHAKYLSTDENISREAATDLALKEFEKLHGELETFKKLINPKYTKQAYVSPDKSARIKEIQDEYQAKIDEANTPIPEPVKAEEKPQPKVEPIEDSKESGKEPPKPPKGEEVDGEGEDSGLSGIKKGLVAKSVIDGVDLEKIGDKEMMTLGRKIIDSGEVKPEALVQKIIEEGKGVLTPSEVVALITYKADIDNGLRDAYKEANEKQAAGEDLGTLGVEIKDLERQQNDFDVMAVITANQQSMAFRLRKMMLDRDYNVVTQIEKYKKNNNGYIPPEIEAKFRDLDKQLKAVKEQLAEAEKKLAEKEGQDAVNNIKESVGREKTYTDEELEKKVQEGVESEISKLYEELPTEKKSAADKAIKALEKFRAKIKGRTYDATLGIPAFIADLGAATAIRAIKVGKTVAQAVEMGINRIKKALKEKGIDKWDKEADYRKDLTETLEGEGVSLKPVKDKPVINEDGTVKIPNQVLRDLVQRGLTDINDLTDAVHKQVVKDLPDITQRQVRDYITDYGKQVNPTADNLQQQVNTAKRVGRLLSELEDLQNKKRKTTNPDNRAKLTEKERDLKRQINALSKDIFGKEEKSDEQKLSDAKERTKSRIAELTRRIKNKDFAKPVKKVAVTDTELADLITKKEKLQEEFDNEQYKLDLKKRTVWQKAEDVALELTSGVVRGLVASIDLSAGFVQGLWRIFSNPVRSLNAFGTMFKHLVSEKASEDYLNKWKASPIYPKLRASKLAIDDKSGKISAKEGLFISNWVNLIWDKIVSPALAIPTSIFTLGNVRKAYNISKAINPYLASQRAFDGYVNSIRINSFVALSKRIEDMGYNYESDPEVFKKAADFVNSTTGRGSLGAADASSRWLNIFLFAPRKVISEIKLFTPYAFAYYGRMPKPVRRQALLSLAKFLGSFMLTNGLMWAARKDWDDDEEDNFWNPNSSDFLTHKIGDKRLSVAGGAKSMIVFQSRFWSGKFTDQYGETTKLGERYGKPVNTRLDLVWRFILGKASPAVSVAAQKADERKGVEMDNTEAIKNLTVPIWMQDLKEMYKDSPAEVSTILTVLSFFGANARTVEPKKSSNNPSKPKIERPKPQKISRE